MTDIINGAGVMITVNGAFIATIGAGSADFLDHKRICLVFRIIGAIFVVIGVSMVIFE